MAHAEIQETLSVSKDAFYDTVVAYESYPQFVDGCKRVEVKRDGDSKATVTYFVSMMMKEISYQLSHEGDRAAGKLSWNLLTSDFLKSNQGTWEIKDAGPGKCTVKYSIEIEFKVPVPSMILNKLVKGSLPSMIKGFEKQAKRKA